MTVRLLIAARRPVRVEDLGLEDVDGIEIAGLARRVSSLTQLIEQERANVALVDVTYPDGQAFDAIREAHGQHNDVAMLALVPEHPDHSDVARAVGAGASGFVDLDSTPAEFADAVRAVHDGEVWLPDRATLTALAEVSADLDVTRQERRSRLVTVVIGLVPVAGVLAAIWSLLWRRYLGHVGVRPVDLAVDPASRTIDAFATTFLLLGWFGPLLYIHTWSDMIAAVVEEHSGRRLVGRPRRLTAFAIALSTLLVGAILALYSDLVLMVLVGPVVAVSILAVIVGLSDSLPPFLRISFRSRRRAAAAGLAIAVLSVGALSAEVMVSGPSFSTTGVEGIVVPKMLGLRAQPVQVTDVDSGEARERLYLGGNADLYVLVDPCRDDAVEMVSVGSSRIDIIDGVTC